MKLLLTLGVFASLATAFAESVPMLDPGFELTGSSNVASNGACPGNYCYTTNTSNTQSFPETALTAGGWNFQGTAGITGPSTAFGPPGFTAANGNYVALLQGPFVSNPNHYDFEKVSSISTSLTFGTSPSYVVDFFLGSRFNNGGVQTVKIFLDTTLIGSVTTTDSQAFTHYFLSPTVVASGVHTLKFEGTADGDETAFLDNISVTGTPEPATLGLVGCGLLLALLTSRRSPQAA